MRILRQCAFLFTLVLAYLGVSTTLFAQTWSGHKEFQELSDLSDTNPKEAIERVNLLLKKTQLSLQKQTYCYMIQSDAHYYNEDLLNSTLSMYRALEVMPKDFPKVKRVEAYNSLGQNLSAMGKGDSAIFYYQKGLPLAIELNDSLETSFLYYNIGLEYVSIAKYAEGLEYLDSAYQISLRIEDSLGICNALRMIGYMKEVHYDQLEAIKIYKEALDYTTADDPAMKCLLNTSIGGAFMYLDILDSASYYANLAAICYEGVEDLTTITNFYQLKGEIAREYKDTTTAIYWFQKAMKWSEEIGDLRSYYTAKVLDLEVNLEQQNLATIEDLLEDKLVTIYPDKLIFLYELYAQLLDKAGEDKKAKEALLKLLKWQRTRMNSENQRVIQAQAVKYGLFKKQKELELTKTKHHLDITQWQNYALLLTIFAVLIVGGYYLYYQRKIFLQEQKRLKQEKELLEKIIQIEGQVLRSQMNPHFIFNALNSIKGLIVTQQNKAAALYISKFSKLVRNVLDNSREQLITLDKEIATLEMYMQLEQARFRDGFEYNIVLDTTINSKNILLPPALVQPFVENSIWHGFKQNNKPNMLEILFTKVEDYLLIKIKDNGVGRAVAIARSSIVKRHKSHGTAITQSRIETYLVGDKKASLNYTDLTDVHGNPKGTVVLLKLPIP